MNIIVTGAASGIGCQVVTVLCDLGHSVIATDVDERQLELSASQHNWSRERVLACPDDVTNPQSWSRLMSLAREHFGAVDSLINVAGVLRCEAVHELKPESVVLQIDVNAKGVILGTQAAAAVMVPRRHGRIINIASMAALAPVPGISVYSASKFAVRGFSLAAAQELEPHGVHVSVVCPDAVATPMVDYQLEHSGAALTFSAPRILTVDEVARAIVGLLTGKPRLELHLPRSRAWLAKASTLFPRSLRRWITARLTKQGLARQQAMRSTRGS
jgi:3-oxoacyl-[acyl-carrier protein] reductase